MENLKESYKRFVDNLLKEAITTNLKARIAYKRLMQIEHICKGLGWDVVEILGGGKNEVCKHAKNEVCGHIPTSGE